VAVVLSSSGNARRPGYGDAQIESFGEVVEWLPNVVGRRSLVPEELPGTPRRLWLRS
jgi:hypothetical protein